MVNGYDCSIVIKTSFREFGLPYSAETIREAVSLLQEEAAIEGGGVCKAIAKSAGVTGCVVTPLSIGTAPLLLYLAMGAAGLPVFVSETRNLYRSALSLLPMEGSGLFDLIQDRPSTGSGNGGRLWYEACRVKGFELRFFRGEAVKLKLDITGERSPSVWPYQEIAGTESGERFSGDYVTYRINGTEYKNIYGLTIACNKVNGTRTEIWIKRVLGPELPGTIEELRVTAQLLRDNYEIHHFGLFTLTLKRLVLVSDETAIDAPDTVIGPLRYYVAGTFTAEIYSNSDEAIA